MNVQLLVKLLIEGETCRDISHDPVSLHRCAGSSHCVIVWTYITYLCTYKLQDMQSCLHQQTASADPAVLSPSETDVAFNFLVSSPLT